MHTEAVTRPGLAPLVLLYARHGIARAWEQARRALLAATRPAGHDGPASTLATLPLDAPDAELPRSHP